MEINLKIDYKPNESQRQFHESSNRYKAMVGSYGSGKTATLCMEGLALSLYHPGNVGLISRRTLPELKTTTMKRFFEFLPDPLIHSWNKTDRELQIRTSGAPSCVYFGPLDEIGRYKSMELGWFAIDEADQTTLDHWLTLIARLRLKGMPQYGMIATNPTSRNHWIYKKWMVEKAPGYEIFRSKTTENVANLPPGYIEELRSALPEDHQKMFLDGEWGMIQNGDPAFPEFRQGVHVKALHPENHLPILRGWDFGRRHPCVAMAQLTETGAFRVLDSILGDNEDLYVFSDRVLKYCNRQYNTAQFQDFCDIAGKAERDSGKSSIAILGERRVFPRYRFSRPDDRVREIRKMMRTRDVDGKEMFQIDPRNQYLVEGYAGGYAVDANGAPKKDLYFDNGMDAVGYIVANACMVAYGENESDITIPEPKWSIGGISA